MKLRQVRENGVREVVVRALLEFQSLQDGVAVATGLGAHHRDEVLAHRSTFAALASKW